MAVLSLANGAGVDLTAFGKDAITEQIKDYTGQKIDDAVSTYKNEATQFLFNYLGGFMARGAGGEVLGRCYVYDPRPIKEFEWNINTCDALPDGGNLCDSVPDLSKFGYFKKRNTGVMSANLARYCNDFFGDEKEETRSVEEQIKNTDFSEVVNRNAKSTEGETHDNEVEDSDKLFGEESPLNIKNVIENKSKNSAVYNAIANNDYESMTAYKMALKRAKEGTIRGDTDLRQINVPYTTIEEYEQSISELRGNRKTLLEETSLLKLTLTAEKAFSKINNDTQDRAERNTQKDAQLQEFLSKYEAMVDKWAQTERDIQLLTNYKESVVYPTKDFVASVQNISHRPKYVYRIEKQKAEKVKLLNAIDKQARDLKDKAYVALHNELIRSLEFDRKTALANIEKMLGE